MLKSIQFNAQRSKSGLILFFIFCSTFCFAQKETYKVEVIDAPMIDIPKPIKEDITPKKVVPIEIVPSYPGGRQMMYKFIHDNLKYPKEAIEEGVEGTTHAEFKVGVDGKIGGIKILKSLGYGTDEEVIRLLKKMPKWKPALSKGKPVVAQYRLPFNFKLSD